MAFSIYDALLEGHRVTLAPTGYFQDRKPMLFDRGTESLWIEMHDGLTAMAGKHFRKRLMRVAIPSPVSWSTWLSRNPQSRLLGRRRSLARNSQGMSRPLRSRVLTRHRSPAILAFAPYRSAPGRFLTADVRNDKVRYPIAHTNMLIAVSVCAETTCPAASYLRMLGNNRTWSRENQWPTH